MSSLGLASGYMKGDRDSAVSDNHSVEPAFLDEAIESRPQLLYTKFQRLKNTTKLAKVIIVDEVPVARSHRPQTTQSSGEQPIDKLANNMQT